MTSSIPNMSPYTYSISQQGASGKLYVPVQPTAVIYAQFDHISGVAARNGQHGISLTKIQILNTLIDNLTKLKTEPLSNETSNISNERADALIKTYQQQIAQTVQLAKMSSVGLAGVKPEVGALFAIDA